MAETTHTAVVSITGQNSNQLAAATGSTPATFIQNSTLSIQAGTASTGAFASAAQGATVNINLAGVEAPFGLNPGDLYTLTLAPYTPPAA